MIDRASRCRRRTSLVFTSKRYPKGRWQNIAAADRSASSRSACSWVRASSMCCSTGLLVSAPRVEGRRRRWAAVSSPRSWTPADGGGTSSICCSTASGTAARPLFTTAAKTSSRADGGGVPRRGDGGGAGTGRGADDQPVHQRANGHRPTGDWSNGNGAHGRGAKGNVFGNDYNARSRRSACS